MGSESISFRDVIIWALLLELPEIFGHLGSIAFDAIICIWYFLMTSKENIKGCMILMFPIMIALFVGFYRGFDTYSIFKDLFYLLTPIVAIMVGEIWATRYSPQMLLSIFIRIGVILAVVNVVQLFSLYGIKVIVSPRLYRDFNETYPTVNNVAIIALSISLFSSFYQTDYRRKIFLIIILAFAIYLSGSRSLYIAVGLFLIGILIPKFQENPLRLFNAALIVFCVILIIPMISPDNRMMNLLFHSFNEIKIQDYSSMEDVNGQYRGFEAYRAMAEYDNLPIIYKIFGGGCGQLVDLGVLSPFEMTKIPILHNGYPYFLIKIGVFGLIVFIIFFASLLKSMVQLYKNSHLVDFIATQFLLIGIFAIITLWVMQISVNAIFNFGYISPLYFISATIYYLRTNQL